MSLPRYVAHPTHGPYASGLDKNPANFAPLTPLVFLERAADVYPEQVAVIHGSLRWSYAELRARCRNSPRRWRRTAFVRVTRLPPCCPTALR